jgi:magnesium transporter
MLNLHHQSGGVSDAPGNLARASLADDVVWLDLLKPSQAEIDFVERNTGWSVPSFEELSEIETSSRLRSREGTLLLSAPLVHRVDARDPRTTPVGFVLGPQRLITVRFEQLTAFDNYSKTAAGTSAEVFAGLSEAIIDRLADVLERIAADLDELSHRLFRSGPIDGNRHHRPGREAADLRAILRRVGANGDLVSKLRDSLLGLGRIVPYVAGLAADWLPHEVDARLTTMRHDLSSLADYNAHLVNKVQLLLDATLGLINIEQNDIIKVLTVVSVVGVPPTLIASIYGMNFKNIPELTWSFGYAYGLAVIALSAIVPLLWFRLRGWF